MRWRVSVVKLLEGTDTKLVHLVVNVQQCAHSSLFLFSSSMFGTKG
jgi:hypothetical protein